MQPRQPLFINICHSIADLRAGKIQRMPVKQAEALIANHRGVSHFTWVEDFTVADMADFKGGNYQKKLIDPEKLGLCYFGPDVGYGTVAFQDLTPGECLVFTGHLVRSEEEGVDASNPYLCSDVPGIFIDAKHKGGYASMLLDAPTPAEIAPLTKKHIDISKMLTANFEPEILSVNADIDIFILKANSFIPKGAILASNYEITMRLLYREFIGFDKAGERLVPAINAELNRVIYKDIGLHLMSLNELLLYKLLKKLAQKKYQSAELCLQKNFENVQELILQELTHLISFGSYAIRSSLLQECETRKSETRDYNRRRYVELIIAMRNKMLEYKGRAALQMIEGNLCQSFILYPRIEYDCFELAGLLVGMDKHKQASKYYHAARLFAAKNQNKSVQFDREITENLEQLTCLKSQ